MKSAALEVFYEVESNGFTSDQNELSCHGVGDIVRDRVLHLRGETIFLHTSRGHLHGATPLSLSLTNFDGLE
jgi:exosome complex RNA-binding protein Csl4